MSIEKVRAYFAQYGIQDRILEFPVSSATVELAAQALRCEPCRIAKTLSFLVGETPVLIVPAGDAKIDNPKYKAQFATKAKMLTPIRRKLSSDTRWAASALWGAAWCGGVPGCFFSAVSDGVPPLAAAADAP